MHHDRPEEAQVRPLCNSEGQTEIAHRFYNMGYRLASIQASSYGVKKNVSAMLEEMTDEEIAETFDTILADLLQEGREIKD